MGSGMGGGAISGAPLKKSVRDVMPRIDKALKKKGKRDGKKR